MSGVHFRLPGCSLCDRDSPQRSSEKPSKHPSHLSRMAFTKASVRFLWDTLGRLRHVILAHCGNKPGPQASHIYWLQKGCCCPGDRGACPHSFFSASMNFTKTFSCRHKEPQEVNR